LKDLDFVESKKAKDFLTNYEFKGTGGLKQLFGETSISDDAMDLLHRLLEFNPK
jgi:hypothetical protein